MHEMSCTGLTCRQQQTIEAHCDGIPGLRLGGPHDLPGWPMAHSIRSRHGKYMPAATGAYRGV
jgi:hypothetical protein